MEAGVRFRWHGELARRESTQALVQREAAFLDRRFATTDEELKTLDVELEPLARVDRVRAKLVFHAPGRVIVASAEADRAPMAVRLAFDDLYDQIDQYIARLRNEPAIRRARHELESR